MHLYELHLYDNKEFFKNVSPHDANVHEGDISSPEISESF